MVYLQLYIRFSGQLRRTRPEQISDIENSFKKAASASGGRTENGRRGLLVFFDEDRIGFWLNIVIFLEKARDILREAAPGLFGYALVLGRDIDELSREMLCLSLSLQSDGKNTGIWCTGEIRSKLEFYSDFSPITYNDHGETHNENIYSEIKKFKIFKPEQPVQEIRLLTDIHIKGRRRNTLLVGSNITDLRNEINNFCTEYLGNTPPLIVRLSAGSRICFADAYTPVMRSFVSPWFDDESLAQMDKTYDLLSLERLRDEWSPYTAEQSRNFFISLIKAYTEMARTHDLYGVLVLDEISRSDENTVKLFREICNYLGDRVSVLACSSGELTRGWKELFPQILEYPPGSVESKYYSNSVHGEISPPDNFPQDVWELAYIMSILGTYFPAHFFPKLFEDEKLNQEMYDRTIEVLASLGFFIPEIPIPGFPSGMIEKHLEEKKDKVLSAVRKLFLSWLQSGKLRPCFNLLKILSKLGERAGDDLVLKSIKSDIINGTWEGIDEAIKRGEFSAVTGGENAAVLEHIFKTSRALVWGDDAEVQKMFDEPHPPLTCYEGCQVQVHINFAAYYIGMGNNEAASEAIRKAMHLNRSLGDNALPAFRFFSLVNLSRRRMDDALEYINFAMDQAEKYEQPEELFITYYYASSINLVFGNQSKAERLIGSAEKIAVSLGQIEWAMRARFFKGRIFFELGRYMEALEVFESLETDSGVSRPNQITNFNETVYAWIYRTKNFLRLVSPMEPRESMNPPSGLDGRIFEIEAAYHDGDFSKAASLADNFITSSDATKFNFLFTEQPDWLSGFSQCEYLLKPEKIPGTKLAWVYKLMAQSAMQPSTEKKAEILNGMQRFMRDEQIPDTDPFDSFYYHAWYCILQDSMTTGHGDINTVLSMALKKLRQRMDRIDVREIKQTFFTLPFWNRNIYIAAKDNMML